MKAIAQRELLPLADPASLVDLDLPVPTPGDHDLLVRVEAISLNPVDVKVRASALKPDGQPRVLGWDAAGVVESVGKAVTRYRAGDAVWYAGDLTRPGSNAQFQLVDERIVGRKPTSLSFAEAAALPLTAITAWELLFDQLRVPYGVKQHPGHLLVINGAGGVGSILVQLARRLTGLTVIATASRPESVEWVRAMGAHHVIDHSEPLDEGLAALGIQQVEYVASLTGTQAHLPAILNLIAPHGRLALIDDPATLDIVGFKRKSVTVSWEFMFTHSMFKTDAMASQGRLLDEVASLVDAGVLRTTLRENLGRIDAATLRRAHEQVEAGRSIGKIVLAGFE